MITYHTSHSNTRSQLQARLWPRLFGTQHKKQQAENSNVYVTEINDFYLYLNLSWIDYGFASKGDDILKESQIQKVLPKDVEFPPNNYKGQNQWIYWETDIENISGIKNTIERINNIIKWI